MRRKKETVTSLALHFFKPAMESTEVRMENDVPNEEEGVPLIFKPLTCSMFFHSGNHRDTREIGIEVNNRNDVGIEMNNRNDVGI